MLRSPIKRARGIMSAKLPSCTEILESEKTVVSTIEKKVIDIPFKIMATMNRGALDTSMKSLSVKVMVRRIAIKTIKISWVMK